MRRLLILAASAALIASPAAADPPVSYEALPNLVPRPPSLELADADDPLDDRAIRLQTPMTNVGEGHLDLLGVPEDALGEEARASQCVEWTVDRACAQRSEVGFFEWHPSHGHHHFQDFARYELRRVKRGRPDMSRAGLVATSGKVSFCLMDTNRADEDEPTTDSYVFGWPLYKSCNVGSGQQGISSGWADTYTFNTPGQEIVIDGVNPGKYVVVVTVDPNNLLFESSDEDNTVAVKVELTTTEVLSLCVFDAAFQTCDG